MKHLLALIATLCLNTAAQDILYQTSFEPPAFTAGQPLRGQANWSGLDNGGAISISTVNPRTGAQAVRIEGGLIEQTGPNYGRAHCFSRALENAALPAPIVEVRANVRLDGPQTGSQGLAGASLMAGVKVSSVSSIYAGGFLISSEGRIRNYSAVPEESEKFSVPYTLGAYRALAVRVDFLARRITWLVDGTELGSGALASHLTADRLYSGYLEMWGQIDPFNTDQFSYDPANYTSYFDDYSLVSVPLSPVNTVIEFAPRDIFGSPDLSVRESDAVAQLKVIRRGFTDLPARVMITISNLTATAAEDFVDVSGFVTFAPGDTNKTIAIPLRDDYWAEPDKMFTVSISDLPPGATSDRPSAKVRILDDDRPGGIDSSFVSPYFLLPAPPDRLRYVDPRIVLRQPDGKLILDLTVMGSENENFPLYWRLLRINGDGSIDPTYPIRDTFPATATGNLLDRRTAVTADGNVLVWDSEDAGSAGGFQGYCLRYQLYPDGSLNNSFTNQLDKKSWHLVPLHDGKFLLSGGTWYGPLRISGQQITNVIRLNKDGSIDPSFTAPPGIEFAWRSFWPLTNGQVLAASISWPKPPKLYRLNTNGSLDLSFTIGAPAGGNSIYTTPDIFSVVPLPDGKIVVGGVFRTFNGQPCNSIVRLNANGSFDSTFQTGTGFVLLPAGGKANEPGGIKGLWSMPGGKLLVTSVFDSAEMLFNGQNIIPPVILGGDGKLDPDLRDFRPGSGAIVDVVEGIPYANGDGFSLQRLNLSLPLRIVSHTRDADGTAVLTANALAGRGYSLQSSDNLLDWTTLMSHPASANRVEFTAPAAASPSKRFYRVKQD